MNSTAVLLWLFVTTSIPTGQKHTMDTFRKETDCRAAVEAITPTVNPEKTQLTCEPKEVKEVKKDK